VAAPEAVETLKWGAPAFTVNGKILLMMAAFKNHAALNFWRGRELCGDRAVSDAMGQFGKLASVEDLPPDDEFDGLIEKAAELAKSGLPARKRKRSAKPLPGMHPDFASALAGAPAAKSALDSFPPSAQRDYLEWIGEAKQESTRQKRIATAIEWLSEGKRLNWKYERR